MSRPSFKDGKKQTDEGGIEWPSVDLGDQDDQDDQDDDLDENPNVFAWVTLEDRVGLELSTIKGLKATADFRQVDFMAFAQGRSDFIMTPYLARLLGMNSRSCIYK
jgi:hypothetical protein